MIHLTKTLKILVVGFGLALLPVSAQADPQIIPLDYLGAEFTLSPTGTLAAVYQNAIMLDQELDANALPITLLDVATGAEVDRLSGHTDYVQDAVFSADGQQLISFHWNGDLLVWDIASGSIVQTFQTTLIGGGRIELLPDGTTVMIFMVGNPGRFVAWDLTTGHITALIAPHFATFGAFRENFTQFPQMMDIAFSAFAVSADHVAAATQNDAVLLWATTADELNSVGLKPAAEQKGRLSIRSMVFSPDGTRLYTADTTAAAITVYDVAARTTIGSIDSAASVIALSPDGQTLAWLERVEASTLVYTANVDDLMPVQVAEIELQALPFSGLAFTADNSQLVAGSLRDEADIYNFVVIPVP